jgi:hypothetical protein
MCSKVDGKIRRTRRRNYSTASTFFIKLNEKSRHDEAVVDERVRERSEGRAQNPF